MTIMNLQNLYARAPAPLQTVMLNLFAARLHLDRYGAPFRKLLDHLLETQWYSPAQIEEYQSARLRQIVKHAYETVPFYRDKMTRAGVKPQHIESVADLGRLPILEKDEIRANFRSLVSSAFPLKKLGRGNTSGTTGSPLSVAWDKHMQLFNNVVDWRQKYWAGVRYGDRIAQILGRPIVALSRRTPPFWQTDYIHNQLWLSAFHMSPRNLPHYVDKLQRFAPVALEGYPSTMYELAKFISEQNATLPVKAVFTSSEPLHAYQREVIEKCFQAKVFDFYGLAERSVFATQCEHRVGQHVNFEYGILELLDEKDQPVKVGQEGVMVTTSLQNFGMPLLRYRVGDRTRLYEEPCACGRAMVRMHCVQSKNEDQIVRPDGTVISPSVLTHPFKPITAIEKSQIIQTDANRITIKVVRRSYYTADDERKLLEEFCKRVGSEFEVRVEHVDDIPRTANGKYRWVVNAHRKSPLPIENA
jgi:phenylacetate-CoA ligase